MTKEDDLYAVIGLGNISVRHRKNLKSLFPSARIACLSSSNRSIEYKPDYSDILTKSIDELISLKPNFVIIASPAPFHAQHSIPFIENNIPVLIEKPIAACIKDAELIAASAKKYKTPVAIGYCLRYKPFFEKVKDCIDSEIIGRINKINIVCGSYLPLWRPNTDYRDSVSASASLGGGALLELSHEIDYANFFIKDLSLQSATIIKSGKLDIDVEDFVDLIFNLPEGGNCKIHLDFIKQDPTRKASFIGTKGNILWNLEHNSFSISAPNIEEKKEINNWDSNKMYIDMLVDFSSNYINFKNSKLCKVSEAIDVLQIIEKAHQIGGQECNE